MQKTNENDETKYELIIKSTRPTTLRCNMVKRKNMTIAWLCLCHLFVVLKPHVGGPVLVEDLDSMEKIRPSRNQHLHLHLCCIGA